MSLPLISVLIPCFNSERTIAKTVKSLLRQSFGNFNCYIIDNCSTDKTVVIVESLVSRDSRFSLDVTSVNRGGPSSFFRLGWLMRNLLCSWLPIIAPTFLSIATRFRISKLYAPPMSADSGWYEFFSC